MPHPPPADSTLSNRTGTPSENPAAAQPGAQIGAETGAELVVKPKTWDDVPPPPKHWWQVGNAKPTSKLHADPECEGVAWAQSVAEANQVDVREVLECIDDVDEHTDVRSLCRMCALEDATLRVLRNTAAPSPTGRFAVRALVTVSATAPKRAASLTSIYRIRRIGQVLDLPVALGERRAVLYGRVPVTAIAFLGRNFDICVPPQDIELHDDVVLAALALAASPTDHQWQAAQASCI